MTDRDTMKQIAQNYKSGELIVLEAPVPACRPGGVLVQSLFSLISTGTEMMKVHEAKLSMVGKARARPDQVRKVLDTVAQQGAMATYKKVINKLDSYTPLGYSLCGVVVEVGSGAEEFKIGQLVAAAGNEFALHAEYNWIPVNLCAAVPRGVAPEHAAFSTVGAIAMHGVRRAEPQLGETALVIGLGLIGQLVVRLLVAAGIRVLGLDVIEDRCRLAEQAGAVLCAAPDDEGLAAIAASLDELTSGRGADHVFLAAGGSSNAPVETAAKLARDRARVVDIGKTKLDLPWNAYYDKELDVRFSRSYGPGRYDDRYELEGIDYPVGYVRWTERRNLECFLDLLARKDLEVATLISGTFPMHDASSVYADLSSGALKAVGVLLEYPAPDPERLPRPAASLVRVGIPSVPARGQKGPNGLGSKHLTIGFIGAGNYASSMLLPHLVQLPNAQLAHVATTRSLSAVNAQRRFGFSTASTSAQAVLDDESLDAIFVVTRHATHADLVCSALETGKAVFVEKPLALTADELDRIIEVVAKTGNDRLMVGFNRRFAPMLTKMKADFGPASSGAVTRYLVNAGPLAADSWYRDEGEGSRFTGEGGHFLDTLSWWADSLPEEVYAVGGPDSDDVQVTVRFGNGASGVISYLTGGNVRFPKETLDVTGGGRSARLDNFRKVTVWAGRGHDTIRARGSQDKGQRAELARFVEACLTGAAMPIPLESLGRYDQGDHRGAGQPAEWQAGAGVSTAATSRLGWYVRRAAQMSPAEMAWRVRDQVIRAAWSPRQVTRHQLARSAAVAPARELAFTAVLPPGTAARVSEEARKLVLEAADRLLAGEWETLGVLRTDLERPDWFRDPVTGRRSDPDKYAFRVDHRTEEQVGNVKQVWELSRLQYLTLLAAAWYLTQDERYARRVADHLRSWWQENPFLSGVHWTSGIELGIRLISLAWIRRLLDDWPGVVDLFERNALALRQIRWHQQYLAAFPSRGSSANNHVIAEAAGLLTASCAFPWFGESERWRHKSTLLLERELIRNTFPSGIGRELASDYQCFIAELGFAAAVEAEASGHPLSQVTWDRLCAMADSAAAVIDERLRPPRQGDSDEGCGLLLDAPEANRWPSLLALADALVGSLDWWPRSPADAGSVIVGALAGAKHHVGGRPDQRPSRFADAGVTLLRTHGKNEIWCRCDGGPHGYLSIAAHAHADALSAEVRYAGVDILADPGTYCYHGERAWRSYFRSTIAHNTVELGGRSQSSEIGPFMWARHARAREVEVLDDGDIARWTAEHDGYASLDPPALHRRSVLLDRASRSVDIIDEIEGGSHNVRLAFHLGPRGAGRTKRLGCGPALAWGICT